jgi:hypothetical protein
MHSDNKGKPVDLFQAEVSAILSGDSKFNRDPNIADFTGFVFPISNFTGSVFKTKLIFSNAVFLRPARFDQVRFLEVSEFSSCEFKNTCTFSNSVFEKEANFFGCQFNKNAFFAICKFLTDSDFGYTIFENNAYFQGSRFVRSITFYSAQFHHIVDFTGLVIGANLALELAALPNPPQSATSGSAVLDFRNATFRKPTDAIFCQVNAGAPIGLRARFANCRGLEKLTFEDVNWNSLGRRRIVLQDELDIRESTNASEGNYELVASAYRGLILNFDHRRQFDLAEDCFCGAFEMKRQDPRHLLGGRFRGIDSFYRRHGKLRSLMSRFSILNLYRILSNYGSSYLQAGSVFLGFLILFAISYPALGIRMSPNRDLGKASQQQMATPAKVNDEAQVFFWSSANTTGDAIDIFGAGLWTAIDQFTFRKSPTVEPATKWARRLALGEMIVVPAQLALILLALRRRFRR